jgi:hypothetical protein
MMAGKGQSRDGHFVKMHRTKWNLILTITVPLATTTRIAAAVSRALVTWVLIKLLRALSVASGNVMQTRETAFLASNCPKMQLTVFELHQKYPMK